MEHIELQLLHILIKHTNISGVGLASIFHYEALNYFPKLKPKVGNVTFLQNISKVRNNVISGLNKSNFVKEVFYNLANEGFKF